MSAGGIGPCRSLPAHTAHASSLASLSLSVSRPSQAATCRFCFSPLSCSVRPCHRRAASLSLALSPWPSPSPLPFVGSTPLALHAPPGPTIAHSSRPISRRFQPSFDSHFSHPDLARGNAKSVEKTRASNGTERQPGCVLVGECLSLGVVRVEYSLDTQNIQKAWKTTQSSLAGHTLTISAFVVSLPRDVRVACTIPQRCHVLADETSQILSWRQIRSSRRRDRLEEVAAGE